MTDSTTPPRDGSAPVPPSAAPSPSDVRAERRRLVESIGALRRLLSKRRAFEVAQVRTRSAGRMPDGIGWQTSGVFLALTATGMFEDEQSDVFGADCVVSVLAAVLFLAGTVSRMAKTDDRTGEST